MGIFSEKIKTFCIWLKSIFKDSYRNITIKGNSIFILVDKKYFFDIIFFFKKSSNCQFKVLYDITCIDYPQNKKRFELVYQILSVHYNVRIFIRVFLNNLETIPSLIRLYPSANWFEREVFDIFGVFFKTHSDLRRILTDYGFEGFPLRKDFPLVGFTEVRYDLEKKYIVTEPVEYSINYRVEYKRNFFKNGSLQTSIIKLIK